MPLAYYSRAATEAFWTEHWGGHTVEGLLQIAQTSPLTEIIERHLPSGGRLLEAGCGPPTLMIGVTSSPGFSTRSGVFSTRLPRSGSSAT